MRVLITGSCGLVGSEAAAFYLGSGHEVIGVDNNQRKIFFGVHGDTGSALEILRNFDNYRHENVDIRQIPIRCFEGVDLIIHCAGQPSHDWAATRPGEDFEINATATLYLLRIAKRYSPNAVFVFMSTNKVYGDAPNKIPVKEFDTRYEFSGEGVNESMTIDQSTHSLFGVSKLAADLMVQEYGRYFGLKTGVFRAGCITGSRHAGTEQHGFLSYISRTRKKYTIYGYKGKQLRDQLHSSDMVRAIDAFRKNPRAGEVYNIGGGKKNTISVLEAADIFGVDYEYNDTPRRGDHRCYFSDTRKFQNDYQWEVEYTLSSIIADLSRGI